VCAVYVVSERREMDDVGVCVHERDIYNVGVYARTRYLQCRCVCTNAVFTMSECVHERGIHNVGVYARTRYLQGRCVCTLYSCSVYWIYAVLANAGLRNVDTGGLSESGRDVCGVSVR